MCFVLDGFWCFNIFINDVFVSQFFNGFNFYLCILRNYACYER